MYLQGQAGQGPGLYPCNGLAQISQSQAGVMLAMAGACLPQSRRLGIVYRQHIIIFGSPMSQKKLHQCLIKGHDSVINHSIIS
jgi:hypothetical protein